MRIDFVYMLLILLLPLIPAFLLFRFLPGSADVQGPFQGLTVKLGGAFAGYFVTVLLSWLVARSLLEPTWSDNWNVVAQIAFDGTPANHPSPTQAMVLVKPPIADIDPSGSFQMIVPIPRVHAGAIDIQRRGGILRHFVAPDWPDTSSPHRLLPAGLVRGVQPSGSAIIPTD